MANFIVTNRHSSRKDDTHPSGASGLLLLGAKLHAIQAITNITVNSTNATSVDMFDILSSVDDLLQGACRLCDGLDAKQIAADISAEAATSDTAE